MQYWIRGRSDCQELVFGRGAVAEGLFDFHRGASHNRFSARRYGLHRVLLCGEVVGWFFWLGLRRLRDAFLLSAILWCGVFSFPEEAIAPLEVWFKISQIQGVGGSCYFWWLVEGRFV